MSLSWRRANRMIETKTGWWCEKCGARCIDEDSAGEHWTANCAVVVLPEELQQP